MSGSITKFITDETGQGIIEYGGVLAFGAGLILIFFTGAGARGQNWLHAIVGWVFSQGWADVGFMSTGSPSPF